MSYDNAIRCYLLLSGRFDAHDYSVQYARRRVFAVAASRFAHALASYQASEDV